MHNTPSHTAILIFSRTAREEAHVKQFGRHLTPAQNLKVAQLLIRRTRRTARRTRLPVFTKSGAQQRGQNFGQRFTNAIADVFAKGFERLVVIGTDCPALSPQILLEAARQLEQGKMVSGADHQGGLYFLGISRRHFCAELLATIPWQSGRDFEALGHYARLLKIELSAGSVLHDIDDAEDLKLAFQNGRPICSMLKKLWRLVQKTLFLFLQTNAFQATNFPAANGTRGPPVSMLV